MQKEYKLSWRSGMKNHWVNSITGSVRVKISGKGLERFINHLTRENVTIWDVRQLGTSTIAFYMLLKDVPNVREIVRHHQVKITFLDRKGAPFWKKRVLKNFGFFLGACLFLFTILLLSNMIWQIEIDGATPETEYKISEELKKMGVKVGQLQFFVDDPETIQRKITNKINEITWVGVELNGTAYHFQVVEKQEPKKEQELPPQHLVASKKAIIVRTFIKKGQPQVERHDFVQKGQLLVSGLIGEEENSQMIAAEGEVWGQTWYRTDVELPLQSEFSTLTGNEKTKHYLRLFGYSLPIWGFGSDSFKEKKIEKDEKKVKFLKWTLPISYEKVTIKEKDSSMRVFTKEEALTEAKTMAKNDLLRILPKDAKILEENVRPEKIENGKLKLTVYYKVIENIAVGQPIIQGD